MKLNNNSYVHLKIRKLCQLLAYETNMQLVTDLDKEFKKLRFANSLSYIYIDYDKNLCFSMMHKITKQEQIIIEELMVHLRWLEIGKRYKTRHK